MNPIQEKVALHVEEIRAAGGTADWVTVDDGGHWRLHDQNGKRLRVGEKPDGDVFFFSNPEDFVP